ncbi:hypothetical protein CFOL_v3_27401 [Cephalotus follicularis]|uniref:Uncharacterized protein n=1 Tax=Cephalotus follicularis TaxID=3775 RepID=A0A1Q3CUM6_CEPFO|nr:hypothetical protein CFOL_v3_27401 [Cephalotus follicularis]
MGTKILRCQTTTNPNSNIDVSQARRRIRIPNRQDRSSRQNRPQSQPMVAKVPAKNLVMGEVRILKRAETLNFREDNSENDSDLVLGSSNRLGPDPESVQKQIRVTVKDFHGKYSGSAAFCTSPPPSSVPVPVFLRRIGAAGSYFCGAGSCRSETKRMDVTGG